jgi:hypothetical protein
MRPGKRRDPRSAAVVYGVIGTQVTLLPACRKPPTGMGKNNTIEVEFTREKFAKQEVYFSSTKP